MIEPTHLLERLEEIGRSLANTPHALALLGLGSAGRETDRMDNYSDLDFFVLVESGWRQHFLEDLSWLSSVAPIAFKFMNTDDGYKLLFEDGIFCEFAVFEPEQLVDIPFAPGRIVWKAEGVPESINQPQPTSPQKPKKIEWLIGEAVTNLYVGLGRERRGEKLSATRFIQGYAVDRIIELSVMMVEPASTNIDPFDLARRYEALYPTLATHLPQFLQGYDKNCQSALAILAFLDYHFTINPAMKAAITELAENEY
jgi:hypothetical protein